MINTPCCPRCGETDSLVLYTTLYWDSDKGEWFASEGNDDEAGCPNGCHWTGNLSDLKWSNDDEQSTA